MAKMGFAIVLMLLAGVWITPFIGAARTDLPSVFGDEEPTTRPTTQPAPTLQLVRGTPGFWRVGRDSAGVWWFISPDDQLEFLNTIQTVQPNQIGRHAPGPHYISRDWDGALTRDGNIQRWAEQTLARIEHMGFKGLGAWSNKAFHQLEVPITRDLNLYNWATLACRRIYHPDWATIIDRSVQHQVVPLRDNRNLVGYYIDNELDWNAGHSPAYYFDNLPPTDPNRQKVISVIRELWSDIAEFNAAWGTNLEDWEALAHLQELPTDRPEAYGKLFSPWLFRVAYDYFETTTTAIRKHDPNHLILGVRFKGYAPPEVVRASRDFTDAQSLNYYVSDGLLDQEMFDMMHELSGQPVIITEYSFHSLDGRSGNRNTFGFAAQVLDQQARADGYRLMTTRLARVPYIIGADWFQWNDEPPSGRTQDGEDVNFGIVDIDDREYDELVRAVRETTPMLNSLHASSYADARRDAWRERFDQRPTFTVPYLERAITLNGELSDWPADTKLPNVRRGPTIGLDRSILPDPNVHFAWTTEGLWIGFEVFDRDIQGAPANGWWWTRDNVELFISTRPTPADQSFYNAFSHQFFFVPIEFPGADGQAGRVGQWHRAGDALTDHRIPHPDVQLAVRVLPDRYVAEMFMPNSALHGFDPQSHPAIAFNIHVRNFQTATDYFWSAPKTVQTQLRPNTWGTLFLQPRRERTLITDSGRD